MYVSRHEEGRKISHSDIKFYLYVRVYSKNRMRKDVFFYHPLFVISSYLFRYNKGNSVYVRYINSYGGATLKKTCIVVGANVKLFDLYLNQFFSFPSI